MNTEAKICPMCEKGILTPITFADDFEYCESTVHVEHLEANICDVCGADPILKEQILRNEARILHAKHHADSVLTCRSAK